MPSKPLPSAFRQSRLHQFRRATVWDKLASFISGDRPLANHHRRGQHRRDQARAGGVFRTGTVTQGDFHCLVRVGFQRQWHECFTAIRAGVHRLAIDLGLPQRNVFRQHHAQRVAASRFHEKPGIRHPLAIAGNLAGKLEEIDHLLDRLTLLEPFDFHPDLEITRRVLPRR